jgi:OFA family oxalate/formate antiporter-like MFS transporter
MIGTATAIVFFIGALFMRSPNEGEVITPAATIRKNESCEEINSLQMIKRSSFWFFFILAVVLAAAGLAIYSHAYAMAEEVALASGSGASAGLLSMLVGLLSVCNGIGRLVFGVVFDIIGQIKTLFIVCFAFVFTSILLFFAMKNAVFALTAFGIVMIGFCYGGLQPCSSSFVRYNYGTKNYSSNFSLIVTNLLFSAFLGPLVTVRLYTQMNSYRGTVICILLFSVVAVICTAGIAFSTRKGNPKAVKDV